MYTKKELMILCENDITPIQIIISINYEKYCEIF